MKNKKIGIKKPQRIEVEVDKVDCDEDMPRKSLCEKLIESVRIRGFR